MKYKVRDRFKGENGLILTIIHIDEKERDCCYMLNDNNWYNNEELDNDYDQIKDTFNLSNDRLHSKSQVGGNHYTKLKIQPYQYAFENELNCYQFNIIKYVTRYKDKNGIEDLKKALHTIEKLIEQEYENRD